MRTEGRICLSFVGFVTDELSGQSVSARIRFYIGDDATGALDIETRTQRTAHQLGSIRGITMRAIHHRCFGPPPEGESCPVRDPVNLDGTPRNSLRDRWRRRWAEPEASAAD